MTDEQREIPESDRGCIEYHINSRAEYKFCMTMPTWHASGKRYYGRLQQNFIGVNKRIALHRYTNEECQEFGHPTDANINNQILELLTRFGLVKIVHSGGDVDDSKVIGEAIKNRTQPRIRLKQKTKYPFHLLTKVGDSMWIPLTADNAKSVRGASTFTSYFNQACQESQLAVHKMNEGVLIICIWVKEPKYTIVVDI